MEYPFPKWRGKPVLMSKHAAQRVLDRNIPLQKVLETLEEGVETRDKRKAGVCEFVKGFKNDAIKIVVADAGENWIVVTVMDFKR